MKKEGTSGIMEVIPESHFHFHYHPFHSDQCLHCRLLHSWHYCFQSHQFSLIWWISGFECHFHSHCRSTARGTSRSIGQKENKKPMQENETNETETTVNSKDRRRSLWEQTGQMLTYIGRLLRGHNPSIVQHLT